MSPKTRPRSKDNAAPETKALEVQRRVLSPSIGFQSIIPLHACAWWLNMVRTWTSESENVQHTVARGLSNILTSYHWVAVESLGLMGTTGLAIHSTCAAQLQRGLQVLGTALNAPLHARSSLVA